MSAKPRKAKAAAAKALTEMKNSRSTKEAKKEKKAAGEVKAAPAAVNAAVIYVGCPHAVTIINSILVGGVHYIIISSSAVN